MPGTDFRVFQERTFERMADWDAFNSWLNKYEAAQSNAARQDGAPADASKKVGSALQLIRDMRQDNRLRRTDTDKFEFWTVADMGGLCVLNVKRTRTWKHVGPKPSEGRPPEPPPGSGPISLSGGVYLDYFGVSVSQGGGTLGKVIMEFVVQRSREVGRGGVVYGSSLKNLYRYYLNHYGFEPLRPGTQENNENRKDVGPDGKVAEYLVRLDPFTSQRWEAKAEPWTLRPAAKV